MKRKNLRVIPATIPKHIHSLLHERWSPLQKPNLAQPTYRERYWWGRGGGDEWDSFRGLTVDYELNGCEPLVLKILYSFHLSFLVCQGGVGETYPSELVCRLRETRCEKHAAQCPALNSTEVAHREAGPCAG